nr:RNA-directed DNA polymerase, eukaryota [Tanacetum cinerariifolium]
MFASSVIRDRFGNVIKDRQVPNRSNKVGSETNFKAPIVKKHYKCSHDTPSYTSVVEPKLKSTISKPANEPIELVSEDYAVSNDECDKVCLGRVKEFASFPVLVNLCKAQGFLDLDIRYMGGNVVHMDDDLGPTLATTKICVETERMDIIAEELKRRRLSGPSREMKILFIHSSINRKRRQAAIRRVIKDGVWMVESNDVKAKFKDHFQSQFSKDGDNESYVGLWLDKAPGPDGFTFGFFKRFWEVIKEDVFALVCSFQNLRAFPCGCNPSFIALIPKIKDLRFTSDFRPISLIECQYKIIGKLLANRLAMVIDSIVIPEQSTFIKGRQILDGPMIINFLFEVMNKMRFTVNWIAWVKATLTSFKASVLLNGALTEEFDIQRGFRQEACRADVFQGVSIGSLDNWISHVLYADDAILLCDWGGLKRKAYFLDVEGLSTRLSFFLYEGADLGERKLHWIAWNRVLSARDFGGLGVGSLDAFNEALLFKWIWRFRDNSNALWEHNVSSIHDTYREGVLGLYNTPDSVLRSGMLNIRGHYFIVQ